MPTTPTFAEVRMPTALSFASEFGPEFSTSVVVLGEGATQRNSHWREDRSRGNVQYSVRTLAYLQQLIEFAHARRGEAQGFRVRVRWDFQGTQQFVGIGDGATTGYQLLKIYDSGPQEFQYIKKIRKPVGIGYPIGNTYDSVALYQDDVWMPSGYTIDYTTGGVVLAAPLGAGVTLTATYEYDWPMRFASSSVLTSLQAIKTLIAQDSPASPGPPQYFTMQDQTSVLWHFWIDLRGALTQPGSPTPPGGSFVNLGLSGPPSWLGVSDELGATWYLFPDTLGQLSVDGTSPAGPGINFNVPLPTPLIGPQLRGEDAQTLYTLAADSAGEIYVFYTLPPDAPAFDALGMTEPIPLIGVR